jgi:NodT family efflux transporter outer membrane factor (OMF) lipoprotein
MNSSTVSAAPHAGKLAAASLLAAALLSLAGCINYAGIKSHAHLGAPDQLAATQSLPAQGGRWPDVNWAAQFGDPQLATLIAEALENSPSVAQARARIAAASAYTEGADAKTRPTVGVDYTLNRERYSGNALYPPPYGGSWFTENSLLLNASFELDLWGKNRQGVQQAISREKAAQADEQQARLTLAATVAQTYNQLAREYALRQIAVQIAEERRHLGAITNRRVAAGLDNQLEQRSTEGNIATSQGTVTQIDGQITLTRYQLGALLGKGPDRGLAIAAPKLGLGEPIRLPDHLPADLVSRRPDLVAARWEVDAASHGIKVAQAEFYPDVNLVALAGFDAFGFGRFLSAGSRQIQAGPAIHLPIFDAGALRANLKGQNANYDSAVTDYNQTLISALNDVATQVATIRSTELQLVDAQKALVATQRRHELANSRFRAGLAPEANVLEANLNVLAQQQALLDLQMSRRYQQMGLLKALGGGFTATGSALAPDDALASQTTPAYAN